MELKDFFEKHPEVLDRIVAKIVDLRDHASPKTSLIRVLANASVRISERRLAQFAGGTVCDLCEYLSTLPKVDRSAFRRSLIQEDEYVIGNNDRSVVDTVRPIDQLLNPRKRKRRYRMR